MSLGSPRLRVVGLGNPLAGDDGLGIAAIECIRENEWPEVETLISSMPGPDLFDGLNKSDLLVLLDACSSGASVGTVHCFDTRQIDSSGLRHLSTHGFGLTDWMSLVEVAGGEIPRIRIFGIEIQHCRMGESLSEAVKASMPELLQCVRACVENEC